MIRFFQRNIFSNLAREFLGAREGKSQGSIHNPAFARHWRDAISSRSKCERWLIEKCKGVSCQREGLTRGSLCDCLRGPHCLREGTLLARTPLFYLILPQLQLANRGWSWKFVDHHLFRTSLAVEPA